eukprot:GSChrysophyteH1.ASY1.ANO1.1161.1 assembled CDS
MQVPGIQAAALVAMVLLFISTEAKKLPEAVKHGETIMYTDISAVNTTEAIDRLMKVSLYRYEFVHDSVEGRKHIGILPKDALKVFPESVDILESYSFPSKGRDQPPTVLSNFPVVDKSGIFMNGLAALQGLCRHYEELTNDVHAIATNLANRKVLFQDIRQTLQEAASEKVLQRKLMAEAALHNEEQKLKAERERIIDDEMMLKAALAEEKLVLERQEALLAERLATTEEREMRNFEEAVKLERELNDRALKAQQETAESLKIRAETEARIEQEKAREEITMRKMEATARLEGEKWKTIIKTVAAHAQGLISAVLSRPEQLAAVVGTLLLMLLCYHVGREVIILLREFIQTQLGKPALVRETNYTWSWKPRFLQTEEDLAASRRTVEAFFEKVILTEEVNERIQSIALATRNTKKSGAPFRHLLLHGPPGTGKTLIARTLAASSGMDYAIMSGGDVGPLGEDAVSQLHRLFSWAKSSSKGLMLFIDEAEAFLNARSSSSGDDAVHRRHALNALLYQTGTQSSSFMLVLATNRPQDIDAAVLDRMDASVLVDLPQAAQRKALVRLYQDEHLLKPTKTSNYSVEDGCYTDEMCAYITKRTNGFSGREISKLFIAANHAMLLAPQGMLTTTDLRAAVDGKINEHKQKETFAPFRDVQTPAPVRKMPSVESPSHTPPRSPISKRAGARQ